MGDTQSVAMDPANAWLSGGGETGALVRATDWSRTPLGPIATWCPALKATVGTLLHSRHPMFLWWGPELVQIYNDAYVPSFGKGKHPRAMGQRGVDCWAEIWPIIFPQIDDVMRRGQASWNEDHLVPVWRNGRIEEVYWTYGYSPVYDDTGAVGGTLVVCTETTARVLAERRLRAMRSLARKTASAVDVSTVIAAAGELFADSRSDVPFALLYLQNLTTGALARVLDVGLDAGACARLDGACRAALEGGAGAPLTPPAILPLVGAYPGGPWPEPSTSAFIAPLAEGPHTPARGYIVCGTSSRLAFDDAYRDHLSQIGEHIALALARIDSYRAREATAAERDRLLMDAPVATALFRGPAHVFELANSRYSAMVNRFDLVGKTYRDAFPELADGPLPGVLDRVYQTGEPFSSGEMAVSLDRGAGRLEDCFFTFSLEALRDAGGSVYGMMAVALDISEQVHARRALERAQSEREGLLAELEAANRAKDEFLAMLGHELRNPLSPIVTALHLIRRRAGARIGREHEIIERQVGHLVRLVDDLLDVSKITRGKIALRREPVELASVVAKAVEMASDLFEQHRHRLVLDVAAEGLRVEGDPVRLAQVIANLLTNAARYTEPGGTVRVRARRDAGEVVVVVEDTGVGIAADVLPRVFDIFVQGQRSTDRKEGGLGLGLALVKSLVTLHEGTVVARSDGPGEGSEFEIRLPATSRGATSAPAPAVSSEDLQALAARKRVLVVDDNVDSVEMIRDVLRSVGYDVMIAHDGPAALAMAETFVPDIALLDIGLPVMDGYELGRRLSETVLDGPSRVARLIALSGYGQEHDRARSKAAGFEAHLVKPVDLDRLLRLLATGG